MVVLGIAASAGGRGRSNIWTLDLRDWDGPCSRYPVLRTAL